MFSLKGLLRLVIYLWYIGFSCCKTSYLPREKIIPKTLFHYLREIDILGELYLTPLSINDSLYKMHLTVISVKGIVWVLISLACVAGSFAGEGKRKRARTSSEAASTMGCSQPHRPFARTFANLPSFVRSPNKTSSYAGYHLYSRCTHYRHTLHLSGWLFVTV